MHHALPVDAIAVAAGLTLLALAGCFARLVHGTGPSRARRILLPAMFFILGMLLAIGVPMLIVAPGPPSPGVAELLLLWLVVPVFVSVAVVDSVAIVLGAERTRRWLGTGIVGAIIITYGWLALWLGDLFFRLDPVAAVPALVAAATAIIWWPYLPRPEGEPDEEAGEIFE
jgi:hypothetical protein